MATFCGACCQYNPMLRGFVSWDTFSSTLKEDCKEGLDLICKHGNLCWVKIRSRLDRCVRRAQEPGGPEEPLINQTEDAMGSRQNSGESQRPGDSPATVQPVAIERNHTPLEDEYIVPFLQVVTWRETLGSYKFFFSEEVGDAADELLARQRRERSERQWPEFYEPMPLQCIAGPAVEWAYTALWISWIFFLIVPWPVRGISYCEEKGYAKYPFAIWFIAFPFFFLFEWLELQCLRILIVPQAQVIGEWSVFGCKMEFTKWVVTNACISMFSHMDLFTNGVFLAATLKTYHHCPSGNAFAKIWKETIKQSLISWVPFASEFSALVSLLWAIMFLQMLNGLVNCVPLNHLHWWARSSNFKWLFDKAKASQKWDDDWSDPDIKIPYEIPNHDDIWEFTVNGEDGWTRYLNVFDKGPHCITHECHDHGVVALILGECCRMTSLTANRQEYAKKKVDFFLSRDNPGPAFGLMRQQLKRLNTRLILYGLLENALSTTVQCTLLGMNKYLEKNIQVQLFLCVFVGFLTTGKNFYDAYDVMKWVYGKIYVEEDYDEEEALGMRNFIVPLRESARISAAIIYIYAVLTLYTIFKAFAIVACKDSMWNISGCANIDRQPNSEMDSMRNGIMLTVFLLTSGGFLLYLVNKLVLPPVKHLRQKINLKEERWFVEEEIRLDPADDTIVTFDEVMYKYGGGHWGEDDLRWSWDEYTDFKWCPDLTSTAWTLCSKKGGTFNEYVRWRLQKMGTAYSDVALDWAKGDGTAHPVFQPIGYKLWKLKGAWQVLDWDGQEHEGHYEFNLENSQVKSSESGEILGTFMALPISSVPWTNDGSGDKMMPCISIVKSEIQAEIRNQQNNTACFVLPSQMNGAKYPGREDEAVVSKIASYFKDGTCLPRAQLAVHPAAGQFMLDAACNTYWEHGINSAREVVEAVNKAASSKAALELKAAEERLQECEKRLEEAQAELAALPNAPHFRQEAQARASRLKQMLQVAKEAKRAHGEKDFEFKVVNGYLQMPDDLGQEERVDPSNGMYVTEAKYAAMCAASAGTRLPEDEIQRKWEDIKQEKCLCGHVLSSDEEKDSKYCMMCGKARPVKAMDFATDVLQKNVHKFRTLLMKGAKAWNRGQTLGHEVSLIYASSVQVGSDKTSALPFHLRVAEIVLVAQYYGALKTCVQLGAEKAESKPQCIYLMDVSADKFNNPRKSVAKAISLAVEMLEDEERQKLDIRMLVESAEEHDEFKQFLTEFGKLKQLEPTARAPPVSSASAPTGSMFPASSASGSTEATGSTKPTGPVPPFKETSASQVGPTNTKTQAPTQQPVPVSRQEAPPMREGDGMLDFNLYCEAGSFVLSVFKDEQAVSDEQKGGYVFDRRSGRIQDDTGKYCGCFSTQGMPSSFAIPEGEGTKLLKCITVTNSEIMVELQKPYNGNAFFVLPSQLNGAEYQSFEKDCIVKAIDDYQWDNTGGPRGQLAVHPAAGQFVLDNAANDIRPDGISAVADVIKEVADEGYGFELQNGYLKVPAEAESKAIEAWKTALKKSKVLVMENVPASGLEPDKKGFSAAAHCVNLVYASAVPVQAYNNTQGDRDMQIQVAAATLVAQYYGALSVAAQRGTVASPKVIYLMPLGGGVFENPPEIIVKGMSLAVEMLSQEELKCLDVRVLTFHKNAAEAQEFKRLLGVFQKLNDSAN